jgi:peptidoglycan/LPS O-acetylase OafA/YrhL
VRGVVFPDNATLVSEASIVALTVLHFGPVFVFGILIAPRISGRIGLTIAMVCLTTGFALICAPLDISQGMGAVLVILAVACCEPVGQLLTVQLLRWLGRVSFSLYLVHWPLTIAVTAALDAGWLTGALCVAASGIAAEIMYRLVELPSIRLGRRFSIPSHPQIING